MGISGTVAWFLLPVAFDGDYEQFRLGQVRPEHVVFGVQHTEQMIGMTIERGSCHAKGRNEREDIHCPGIHSS